MDFERLFLDNLPLVDRIVACTCRRNRLTKEESEDFGSVVKLKLIANDYQVLREFCHKSTLGGYLIVVIGHAYRDHRNHVWGKWRPSAEARRLGPLAVRLDTMIHRDGLTLDEACAHAAPEDREEMRRLAAKLLPRTKRRMEDAQQLEQMPSNDRSPEARLMDDEREAVADRLARAIGEALGGLAPEDRLLVRMKLEEGVSLASLARADGRDARSLYRRWEMLIRNLRRFLEEQGFDAQQVAWVLESASTARGGKK